jgi:ABC-type lipoprotein export system ATPase subunit
MAERVGCPARCRAAAAGCESPVLRLDKVCKSYNIGTPVEVEVLHDIGLTLERGEFVALIGPSGSGKSTLLNIVGLLDKPSKGRVFIEGRETSRLDDGECLPTLAKEPPTGSAGRAK